MDPLLQKVCKAARALAGWSIDDLAQHSGVSVNTLRSFESGRTKAMNRDTERAVRRAFDEAGVELIPENGGGAGARLRDRSGA